MSALGADRALEQGPRFPVASPQSLSSWAVLLPPCPWPRVQRQRRFWNINQRIAGNSIRAPAAHLRGSEQSSIGLQVWGASPTPAKRECPLVRQKAPRPQRGRVGLRQPGSCLAPLLCGLPRAPQGANCWKPSLQPLTKHGSSVPGAPSFSDFIFFPGSCLWGRGPGGPPALYLPPRPSVSTLQTQPCGTSSMPAPFGARHMEAAVRGCPDARGPLSSPTPALPCPWLASAALGGRRLGPGPWVTGTQRAGREM